jgi:(p)ppGpp synthase/HD superfamily hydrolase
VNLVDVAQMIAMDGHCGQINKHDGEPYILHPQRVAILCRDEGLDEVHQAVAWLHDVLEDTHWSALDVSRFFPDNPEVVTSVIAITKRKGMSNDEYYEHLKCYPVAARVKLRDMQDNFRRNHMITDEAKRARMASKYSLGMDRLSEFRVHPVPA